MGNTTSSAPAVKASPSKPCCAKSGGKYDATVTPKGTLTLRDNGQGKPAADFAALGTLKFKRGKFNGSLAMSDRTLRSLKSKVDLVATLDYNASKHLKGITLNAKHELGPGIYQAGATWLGDVSGRSTTLKMWYTNRNNLVNGELTMGKSKKFNTTFTQKQLLTAKYSVVDGDYIVEPAYNFVRDAATLAVTKKLNKSDTLKLTTDIKGSTPWLCSAEWARKPYKINLSTVIDGRLRVSKPVLSAIFENVYEI